MNSGFFLQSLTWQWLIWSPLLNYYDSCMKPRRSSQEMCRHFMATLSCVGASFHTPIEHQCKKNLELFYINPPELHHTNENSKAHHLNTQMYTFTEEGKLQLVFFYWNTSAMWLFHETYCSITIMDSINYRFVSIMSSGKVRVYEIDKSHQLDCCANKYFHY